MESQFKGLKIVELASVLAGPAVGMFFSELGAEVIKIENKLTNGDVTRSWKSASENKDSSVSAYYASVNWNKKSLFIDLTNEKEKLQVIELIKNADILISNYKPGDDIKLGMDHETLKKINPAIIYAQITGFGETSSRTAYDIVLQAETGFMYLNSMMQGSPLKMPVALIDILAAHQLKEGILIALIKKYKTGKGSKVSVSLFDTAVSSLANQAGNWLMTKHDPQPLGSLHPNIAPYGEIVITADNKQIVLAIGSDRQFERLCSIINAPSLSSDPKFINNIARVKNRSELLAHLKPLIFRYHSANLMNDLLNNDVPVGLVRSVKEVFENNDLTSFILEETNESGDKSKCVKTAAFSISA